MAASFRRLLEEKAFNMMLMLWGMRLSIREKEYCFATFLFIFTERKGFCFIDRVVECRRNNEVRVTDQGLTRAGADEKKSHATRAFDGGHRNLLVYLEWMSVHVMRCVQVHLQ